MTQPAAPMPDELRGEAQQHFGQLAASHQFGCEDEKRHGEQRKTVDAGEHLLQHDDRRVAVVECDREQCSGRKRERDRHAEREQHGGRDKQSPGH